MVHENTNQMDNDTDDTISFTQREMYFFNAEKSQGLTGDEEVVVPHLFILSSANYVLRTMPGAMSILGNDFVFNNLYA